MPDFKHFWSDIAKPGTPACAVFCSILGIVVALSMLVLGFWKTALLVLCFALGWFLGAVRDKQAFFRRWLARLTGGKYGG